MYGWTKKHEPCTSAHFPTLTNKFGVDLVQKIMTSKNCKMQGMPGNKITQLLRSVNTNEYFLESSSSDTEEEILQHVCCKRVVENKIENYVKLVVHQRDDHSVNNDKYLYFSTLASNM